MAGVIEGVETDKITVEEGPQKLVADRDGTKDLRGREGRVEEKSKLYSRRAPA